MAAERSNPFTPTFGTMPPVVSGRADTLGRIAAAFTDGPRTPYRTMILLGQRGSGKTVMLNAARAMAVERGWGAIAASASVSDVAGELVAALRDLPPDMGWSEQPAGFGSPSPRRARRPDLVQAGSLTRMMTELASTAQSEGSGVLMAMDELQSINRTAGRDIAVAVQEVVRNRQLPMVFIGAGLPELEDTLLGDDAITFFGRCLKVHLDAITDEAAAYLLTETAAVSGGTLRPGAVSVAVEAAHGSPFLLQSVGFHSWDAAADPAAGITVRETDVGIAAARQDMISQIVVPVWRHLDDTDRECLALLAGSGGAASPGLFQRHMGRWRAARRLDRLIRGGVLERQGSEIRFVHEVFGDWVRRQLHLHGDTPALSRSQKDVALAALQADRRATYDEISRRTGIDRSYVGRIARQTGLNEGRPRSQPHTR